MCVCVCVPLGYSVEVPPDARLLVTSCKDEPQMTKMRIYMPQHPTLIWVHILQPEMC